jgi:hypothetical protein
MNLIHARGMANPNLVLVILEVPQAIAFATIQAL